MSTAGRLASSVLAALLLLPGLAAAGGLNNVGRDAKGRFVSLKTAQPQGLKNVGRDARGRFVSLKSKDGGASAHEADHHQGPALAHAQQAHAPAHLAEPAHPIQIDPSGHGAQAPAAKRGGVFGWLKRNLTVRKETRMNLALAHELRESGQLAHSAVTLAGAQPQGFRERLAIRRADRAMNAAALHTLRQASKAGDAEMIGQSFAAGKIMQEAGRGTRKLDRAVNGGLGLSFRLKFWKTKGALYRTLANAKKAAKAGDLDAAAQLMETAKMMGGADHKEVLGAQKKIDKQVQRWAKRGVVPSPMQHELDFDAQHAPAGHAASPGHGEDSFEN